ncbi:hypothetical protein MXC99_04830 [Thauera aromatica]|uniref:hypothetical protein n=1 Tax=Thauera aromatica TaxID=59405 RepID=UPI001FFCC743|nr:hypothetical protein [Thauera aromatica]MCK2087498.1 hypothetical protein [Thauera aromatica]
MNIIAIQINQIQIYRLSSFPEQRINQLVSELNVHYGKINNYIEAQIERERIDVEVIDSLTKLEEIARLAPHRIQVTPMSGDFRLGVDLLESIIALLNTQSGHASTRKNLLNLGWDLLRKLYPFSYERLVQEALRFSWLKRNNLVRSHEISRWNHQGTSQNESKVRFSPSEEEIDNFYNKNRQELYEYMIYEMGSDRSPPDPFDQLEAADFYHYHRTLSNVIVLPESTA